MSDGNASEVPTGFQLMLFFPLSTNDILANELNRSLYNLNEFNSDE